MAARSRFRWQFLALAALAIVLVAIAILWKPAKPPTAPKAVPVSTAVATAQDLPVSVTTLGAAQAWTSDTIYAQVSGKLLRVSFTEGSYVKAGQVLAEVDPAPYQAALTQAE